MRNRSVISMFLLIGIFLLGTAHVSGQVSHDTLKQKRISLQIDHGSFGDIVKRLIVDYDIPIGFEESALDRARNDFDFEPNMPLPVVETPSVNDGRIGVSIITEPVFEAKYHEFSIHAENSSLDEVMNMIVGQMPNYKWELSDGIVNIFPAKGRDEKYKNLLDVQIKSFVIKRPAYIGKIRNTLLTLPEITEYLQENDLRTTLNTSGYIENLKRELPSELNFSNFSLRQLLNNITKIKRGGWILRQHSLYGAGYVDIKI